MQGKRIESGRDVPSWDHLKSSKTHTKYNELAITVVSSDKKEKNSLIASADRTNKRPHTSSSGIALFIANIQYLSHRWYQSYPSTILCARKEEFEVPNHRTHEVAIKEGFCNNTNGISSMNAKCAVKSLIGYPRAWAKGLGKVEGPQPYLVSRIWIGGRDRCAKYNMTGTADGAVYSGQTDGEVIQSQRNEHLAS